jgi:hypothetical protein
MDIVTFNYFNAPINTVKPEYNDAEKWSLFKGGHCSEVMY